jgi:NDP-sugar pyrophosphorylase family protein
LLRGWCNKATGERIITGSENEKLYEIAFSSIAVLNPEIFRYMTDGVYTMTALYLQLASSHKIVTCRYDGGYWANVGTPEILDYVRNLLKS